MCAGGLAHAGIRVLPPRAPALLPWSGQLFYLIQYIVCISMAAGMGELKVSLRHRRVEQAPPACLLQPTVPATPSPLVAATATGRRPAADACGAS